MNDIKNVKHEQQRMKVAKSPNALVIKKWFGLKAVEFFQNIHLCETYFFERETEKALLFVNIDKTIKQWVPKSAVVYWTLPLNKEVHINDLFIDLSE